VLRSTYEADAERIALALREVFDADVTTTLPAARARITELDAAIRQGVGTVMKALDLVREHRPAKQRRATKAAARERRRAERFWTRQLMHLVDLQTHVSWITPDGAITRAWTPTNESKMERKQ